MRVIHTSDWHIGRTLGGYSLLEDQAHFLGQLADYLTQVQADALIIAGDLYDRAVPSAQAVALLDRFLTDVALERGIPVLAIAGNHDSPERLSFSNRLLERGGLFLQGEIEGEVRRIDRNGVRFHLLPYLEPAAVRRLFPEETVRTADEAAEVIARRILNPELIDGVNILISHGFYLNLSEKNEPLPAFSESERSVGGSDAVNAGWFSAFDYLALGHLHAPQQAAPNARYSGSPLKYSVSEAAQRKSVTRLDIQDGTIAVSEQLFPPLRDVRVIEGELSELIAQPSDDYVFVNLTDREYQLDAISRLCGAYPHILGLEYPHIRWEEARGAQAAMSKTPLELFDEFYRGAAGEPMQEEQKNLIEQMLAELEGDPDEDCTP